MAEDKEELEKQLKEWWDENMSHGAFSLTQEEIDFYYKPKTKRND